MAREADRDGRGRKRGRGPGKTGRPGGANHTRLTQVKAAYDPDRVFTFPQAV
jgi:Berberine and berberine like